MHFEKELLTNESWVFVIGKYRIPVDGIRAMLTSMLIFALISFAFNMGIAQKDEVTKQMYYLHDMCRVDLSNGGLVYNCTMTPEQYMAQQALRNFTPNVTGVGKGAAGYQIPNKIIQNATNK